MRCWLPGWSFEMGPSRLAELEMGTQGQGNHGRVPGLLPTYSQHCPAVSQTSRAFREDGGRGKCFPKVPWKGQGAVGVRVRPKASEEAAGGL